MRKLYALLAGIGFALAATHAQMPVPDVANFTATVNASGLAVFTNTSVIGNVAGPRHAYWSFGDGSSQVTGPLEGTQHQYQAAGTYTVCLKIVRYASNSNDSVVTSQVCKTIVIESVCRADFERLPTTSSTPLSVTLKALPWHSNQNKPVYICWKFGDGSDTCIQYSNTFPGPYTVNHTYAAAGQYEVCVKIVYQGGCEARRCKLLAVGQTDSCKADFERLPVTTSNNVLQAAFKALPWHNNNKKPSKICWRFGDGKDTCINYGQDYTGNYTVNHLYPEPGPYEVCVKIIYYGGCEAYKCKEIHIARPDSCSANFERLPVTSTNHPLTTVFKALPWHNNQKKPKRICWTFGDGKDTCINYLNIYNGPYTVAHTYNQPGNYQVCVKILYYGDCEAYKCKEITVSRPDECKADFERIPLTTANHPLTTAFRALPWHHNQKKPKRICWTFGDGKDTCINYGEDYNGPYVVGHTYAQPGEYEVCVKILYYGGCEARKCKEIRVPQQSCKVEVHELATSATGLERGFYAAVASVPQRSVQRICWNFGDGSDTCINATATDPADLFIRHTYPGPGVYRACVKVLFEGGCEAHDCEEVVIRSNTDLCGGYMTDSLVAPRTFKFKGFAIHRPNDEVLYYKWTFGDGSSATGREVTHTYNVPGEYRVCLTIVTRSGCETKICNTVRVPGPNTPRLIITPNPVVNALHALFYSTHTETVTIKLINSNGVVVRSITRNAVTGANNWDFDASGLLPGYYNFLVQSPNQMVSAMFLKL